MAMKKVRRPRRRWVDYLDALLVQISNQRLQCSGKDGLGQWRTPAPVYTHPPPHTVTIVGLKRYDTIY